MKEKPNLEYKITEEQRVRANDLINEIFFGQFSEKFSLAKGGKTQYKSGIINMAAYFENEKELKSLLEDLYIVKTYGYKAIVSMLENENVTYTKIRRIFKKLGIETRTGIHVCTEELKHARSAWAKLSNNFTDWPEKHPEMLLKSKRFVGGYYFNKYKNKYQFLRSSWEYIYAKMLDNQGINWSIEERTYLLSNGKYYRPDFFIYDENDVLIEIVEVKSMFNFEAEKRLEKYYMFTKEYSHIKTTLVRDKEIFQVTGVSQSQAIRQWKKNRVLTLEQ